MTAEETLSEVARGLEFLEAAPVFIGGATVGLMLDELGRSQLRPTLDVDCIPGHIDSRPSWWRLEAELRRRGWVPDEEGPLCRYRTPDGTAAPEVLGFSGRWYRVAATTAVPHVLSDGTSIQVLRPEVLLACKLEASHDRGRRDPYASKDLEDIVALLDGCRELESSLRDAAEELRAWVVAQLRDLLRDGLCMEAVIGQLPRGGDVAAREKALLERMGRMAGVKD